MRNIKNIIFISISLFLLITVCTSVLAKTENPNANSNANKTTGNAINTNVVKNPQAKAAIQTTTEITQESEDSIDNSFKEMSGRPGFLKFIIGPDYKNAGKIRSEIVRLRNEIAKLTRMKINLSASDQAALDESIKTLQANLTAIETRLSNALKGLSLFGWLSKFLTGFIAPTPSPTPTASATATPVLSASPTPTAEASPSP